MTAKSHSNAVLEEALDVGNPQLSRYLFQVEEAERRRLARELHDETSQGLSLLRFYLGALSDPGANNRKALQDAFHTLDHTISGLRRIVARLSPETLEKLGLAGSIRKEARALQEDHGVQVNVRISEKLGELSAEAELALYRLVQEALHNIAKHAQAKNAEVDLTRKEGRVRLVIQDDGVGVSRKNGLEHHSFGIAGMRERVRCLNGTFRIRSRQGRGTRIEVYLSPVCGTNSDPSAELYLVKRKVSGRSLAAIGNRHSPEVGDAENPMPAR